MATSKSLEHPTPNGGVRSEVNYLDDDWKPVDEKVATAAEIIEYDASGKVVGRTYGVINRGDAHA